MKIEMWMGWGCYGKAMGMEVEIEMSDIRMELGMEIRQRLVWIWG